MENEILALKARLKKLDADRKSAFEAGAGDGWDSPEFEEIERESELIVGQINNLSIQLSQAVIIDRIGDESIVDIGDILTVDLDIDGDTEEMTFKLTGGSPDFSSKIQEISLNSPLGASVYKKKIGDTSSYIVEAEKINVYIKSKLGLDKKDPSLNTSLN